MNALFRLTPGVHIALGSSFLTMQTSAALRWKALGYSVSHHTLGFSSVHKALILPGLENFLEVWAKPVRDNEASGLGSGPQRSLHY